MGETITKKMFQIGDIAVLANKSGENFLYDTKEKKVIGNGEATYTDSFVKKSDYSCRIGKVHTGMILQRTKNGRCRIYDAYNKRMVVENMELINEPENNSLDLVAVLKNPETGKYHIFNSAYLGVEGYDIFQTPFDNVKRCDPESISPLVLTLNGKCAYYYAGSAGLITGFDYDDIEQIIEDHIIVTNGKDKQFVIDGDLSNMSQIYEDIKVSGNKKHSSSTVYYCLYCSKDDYTDIYEASWRGINRKFRAPRYDNIEFVSSMTIDKDKKDEPTKYLYYFYGEKDGQKYLLRASTTDATDKKQTLHLKEIAHITNIEPLGNNASVLQTEDGKRGLLISYPEDINDYGRRGTTELFEPNYDSAFRFGKNFVFGLRKGDKVDVYSSNLCFQSKGGYFKKGIEIVDVKGDKVIYKKDRTYGIGELNYSDFYARHGYSNVRYLGGGFWEYTEDGKKGVYDTIKNICEEIHYVGPKDESDRYSKQIFVVKARGEYEYLEYDPCCPPDPRYDSIEIRNDRKPYLKADKLSFCGKMVNALKDKKSALYTLHGDLIKSYENPVEVTIKKEMDEQLYVVKNKDNVDYFELTDNGFKQVEIIDIGEAPAPAMQKKKSISKKTAQKKDE